MSVTWAEASAQEPGSRRPRAWLGPLDTCIEKTVFLSFPIWMLFLSFSYLVCLFHSKPNFCEMFYSLPECSARFLRQGVLASSPVFASRILCGVVRGATVAPLAGSKNCRPLPTGEKETQLPRRPTTHTLVAAADTSKIPFSDFNLTQVSQKQLNLCISVTYSFKWSFI